VRNVKFIKKNSDCGQPYNSVIVIFESWNVNQLVQKLFNEMASSIDGTTKFYFNPPYRYWVIQVHRQKLPECHEPTVIDPSLSDKDKIAKLEELVKSMSAQIHYMQTRQERTERSTMDLEFKETYHHIVNNELRSQLEEKEWEKRDQDETKKLREENEYLRCQLELTAIDIVRKDYQIEKLQEELKDKSCILSYVETQTQEMKQMLQEVLNTDPIKPIINSYIKEYIY